MKLYISSLFICVMGLAGSWIAARDGWLDPRVALLLYVISIIGIIGMAIAIINNK